MRQAQDFTLRYPIIDGQGNFGSRDGDGAAAMRYTECRLTPIAELLLGEIDRDTVDFGPNYDGSFREPKLLPARLPMVLLNGSSGIGVGMATEIPSHNLREVAAAAVALLRNPELDLDGLMQILPGPDLPGGGQIISPAQDLRQAYASGRGSLRVRARWHIEDQARGQWRVVFTELPHGVSTRDVLEDIERITNPKPKEGKKALSPDQANLKALMLTALETVRDESDKNASVRLVCEPRSSRQDQDEFVQLLLVNTRLESSLSINLVMLGRDGRPRQKHLREILQEWLQFRFDTVVRRTRHRLDEVDRRIHILEGRALALLNIDEVIRVIREADDPKADLIQAFGLTEIQAEDILEIRLRQLARLEAIKIEKELKELRTERKGLQKILDNRDALENLVAEELEKDAEQFGDKRRTLIESVSPAVLVQSAPDEPVTITLSRHGWIRSRQGHGLDAMQFSYKAGDAAFAVMETRTLLPVIVLDTKGRAYSIRAADIPGGRGDGVPVTTLIELQAGAKVCQAFSLLPETKVLVSGTGGYGFITTVNEMISRVRAGKTFMTLEDVEQPLMPTVIQPNDKEVAVLSESARMLIFPIEEMREMPRGRGVILMGLDEGENLLSACTFGAEGLLVEGAARGGVSAEVKLSGIECDRYRLRRARRGAKLETRVKPRSIKAAHAKGN